MALGENLKDNYIYSYVPTANYGTDDYLTVRNDTYSRISKILISFDITGLSSGSNCELGLYRYDTNPITSKTISCYKLKRADWNESQSTWNIYKTANNWQTAGASGANDYDSTIVSTTILNGIIPGWIIFDVSTHVQDAIGLFLTQVDFLLLIEATGDLLGYGFRSKEYSDSIYRPYLAIPKSFTADTISSVTESFSVTKSIFDVSVANNLTAYVMNKNKGWSKITKAPYTSMIYRPSLQELWATRRDKAQLSKVNSGTTFDTTAINATLQTGYFDFGQFDEVQVMEGKMASAIKRLRALHSEVKSDGNLILIVYTENDSTGKSFTITPATSDNVVYNMVRTTLSRDIRGKFISFKIANESGEDFFVGKLALRIIPKGLR